MGMVPPSKPEPPLFSGCLLDPPAPPPNRTVGLGPSRRRKVAEHVNRPSPVLAVLERGKAKQPAGAATRAERRRPPQHTRHPMKTYDRGKPSALRGVVGKVGAAALTSVAGSALWWAAVEVCRFYQVTK